MLLVNYYVQYNLKGPTMKSEELYVDIIGMLSLIDNDEEKLMAVLNFLENQILNDGINPKNHELSEEYRSTILQIAHAIDSVFVCYLNPDTLEIEQVENRGIFENEAYNEQNDDLLDEYDLSNAKWDDRIKFEPLDSNDVLLIMQKFVTQLNDEQLSRKLESVLGEENPVTKFRRIIEKTDKRSAWKAYKDQATIDYVKTRLLDQMRLR